MTSSDETKRTVAEWTESPYTSYDRRGDVVQHRVVVIHYERVVADVIHEVRSSDSDAVPSEWTELDAVELRDHGLRHRDGRTEVLRS